MEKSQKLQSEDQRKLRKKNRSVASLEHRNEILSTPLPPTLAVRKKYKERVAVRTVSFQIM